ncbi:MAG: hypothetical protein LBF93_09910 [Zoogloeaceae bacterium]|nr:hypothetical protein [Zoogloeaceae bacterium]
MDFFHVCDYLDDDAQAIATTGEAARRRWMETQKERLNHGQAWTVLEAMKPYRENRQVEDDQAPVRVRHRYLTMSGSINATSMKRQAGTCR